MRNTERRSVWAWIALAVVVIAGAAGAAWQVNRSRDLQSRLGFLESELASIEDASNQHDEARNRLARLEERVASMRQVLPPTANLAELFGEVTGRMRALGLNDPDLKSGSVLHRGTHSTVPVEVNFRADGGNALRFVREIEGLARLIRLTEMHLERDGSRPAVVTADLKLEAFFGDAGGDQP